MGVGLKSKKKGSGKPRETKTSREENLESGGCGVECGGDCAGRAMEKGLKKVGGKSIKMDGKLKKIDGKLKKMDGKSQKIDGKLKKVDGKSKEIDETSKKFDGKSEEIDEESQQMEEKPPKKTAQKAPEQNEINRAAAADLYAITEEMEYLKSEIPNRWRNKQRVLTLCTRRIPPRYRHFLEDLRKLLPHQKPETKWERRQTKRDINELCEMKYCNNCILLETRRDTELYMWISKTPEGPSAKFQVLNVHTNGELSLTGNCILFSRPLVVFDTSFDDSIHLQLIKELLLQAFGTPRNHPLAKPFHDHVISFFYLDSKIWFRHYQISPQTEDDLDKPDRQILTEIGPRFVLDPIKIFDESFGGKTLWQNELYLSPVQVRSAMSSGKGSEYAERIEKQEKRQAHIERHSLEDSAVADDSMFD